jgi:hypothetical protein
VDEEEEENYNSDFIERLDSLADKEGGPSSIRWALSARADGMFDVELQSLPVTATVLNSSQFLLGM